MTSSERKTANVAFRQTFSVQNPRVHTIFCPLVSLSVRSGPVQSSTTHSLAATLLHLDPFTVKNEESKSHIIEKVQYPPFHAGRHRKNKNGAGQWVNKFTANLQKKDNCQTEVAVVPAAWLKKKHTQENNAASKTDQRQ